MDIWICGDCRIYIANGDLTGLDASTGSPGYDADRRAAEIVAGVGDIVSRGYIVVGDGYNEHSIDPCACCKDRAHGERWSATVEDVT